MANEVEKLVHKAQQAISKGKYDKAKELYLEAIKLRPSMPNLYYGLATVHYLLHDYENAAYYFKEVTRLDPIRAGAYINLGAVYNKLGRLDEAIATLRKGIQLDLQRPEGYYNLGLVYRRKGQIDLAIQAYREATRVAPRMADAHYNLANLYLEKGQYTLAIDHYERALQLRPNWEKAALGLQAAQEALDDESGDYSDEPTSHDIPTSEEDPTQRILDPERMVDPQEHGVVLSDLHQATKSSEATGREYLELLQTEVEPAIKELSNCLLATRRSSLELDECAQRVEAALSHMAEVYQEFEENIEKVRKYGNKLLNS